MHGIFRGKPIAQRQGAGGAALVYAAVNDEELHEIEALSGKRYASPSENTAEKLKARRVSLAALISKAPGVQGRLYESEISASGGAIKGVEDEGSQGLAFVMVGKLVYDLARKNGLGVELPTELFLQDIRD